VTHGKLPFCSAVHCKNAAVYAHGSVATGRASLAKEKRAEVGL